MQSNESSLPTLHSHIKNAKSTAECSICIWNVFRIRNTCITHILYWVLSSSQWLFFEFPDLISHPFRMIPAHRRETMENFLLSGCNEMDETKWNETPSNVFKGVNGKSNITGEVGYHNFPHFIVIFIFSLFNQDFLPSIFSKLFH